MVTMIRSGEAATILGVRPATLYAYVSRGRLRRTIAPDGRTSLYERDEVEALAERSRRAVPGPRPTIDVQITSSVTTMDADALWFRGVDAIGFATTHRFEDVAELLWSGSAPATATHWPTADRSDAEACAGIASLDLSPISRLGVAAQVLAERHPDDDATRAARRLLLQAPGVLGARRRSGPFADRLTSAWTSRPTPELAAAIDRALALLADHELATSTLAVRIAASVRTSPAMAIAAGLATIGGALHGSASAAAHRFLEECAAEEPAAAIARHRRERQRIPGIGHSVYRGVDPRFPPLMEAIARLDPSGDRLAVVELAVTELGRVMSPQPNVDLALGALTWIAGLDPHVPIFAVARIAGWAAHYDEELRERPVRFRGVARAPM